MSMQVRWPQKTPMSAEERVLRDVFEHVGVDLDMANSAMLRTLVERYQSTALRECRSANEELRGLLAEAAVKGGGDE